MAAPLSIGLVAGEASGDTLGAHLIEALRALVPEARFFGIAGPKMQAAGCEVWEPSESLAVMGLFEILRDLPRLLRLRARIRRRFLEERPDVFVGIDAPEFNLSVARALHEAGIPTVQYVSPQVWAWRQSRVHSMHESVDLVLCLLPFEKRFYDDQGLRAEFVGHPLADAIPLVVDRAAARAQLKIAPEAQVVALLPGSRRGEVTRLAADFAATARILAARRPDLQFLAPMANASVRAIFADALARAAPELRVLLLDGGAQAALAAADVVLVASGTASLEAALSKRPMVVVYRLGAMTAWVLRRLKLVKTKYFAQPNLLADRRVVSEYFQEEIVPETIGAELLMWLDDPTRRRELEEEFTRIHAGLRSGGSKSAALAILALLDSLRPAAEARPGEARTSGRRSA
ncbi:MAG TPA: lipid-A-disaccharide synthase [Steroidobacteraceae bacterium]|nr:lipid-A-disaccharide synthase [Steroidobacteraceae bacterium]